jgi:hypothetical protein
MINRPLHHEDDMEQEKQDSQLRPIGAKKAHIYFIGALLFVVCYMALALGLLR